MISLTPAQLLTIVSELGGKQTKQVRIKEDPDEHGTGIPSVLVTYDAGWGTLTLNVFQDGSSRQAGMGEVVEA